MNLTRFSWIDSANYCLLALPQPVHLVLTEACLCPLQLLKAQRAVMMSQARALTQDTVMQIHK